MQGQREGIRKSSMLLKVGTTALPEEFKFPLQLSASFSVTEGMHESILPILSTETEWRSIPCKREDSESLHSLVGLCRDSRFSNVASFCSI
jgi:hypothetical protein